MTGLFVSASAGSGKTYFIVENFLQNLKKNCLGKRPKEMKEWLEGVVFITFTVKSANELRERIYQKLEYVSENSEEFFFTKELITYLPLVNISTFHSFYLKIIKEWSGHSFIKVVPPQEKIRYVKRKIHSYVEEFSTKNPLFYREKKLLLEFLTCFYEESVERFLEKNDISDLKVKDFFIFLNKEKNKENLEDSDKWKIFFQDFDALKDFSLIKKKELEAIDDFFLKYKGLKKDKKLQNKELYLLYGEIKDFWKKEKEHFYSFVEHVNFCLEWKEGILNFFELIEKRKDKKEIFLTYAQIEKFLENILLEDPIFLKKLQKRYKIFYIDEAQDTSHLQFEIIKKLAKDVNKKIIVVGDEKQAIYQFRGGSVESFFKIRSSIENKAGLTSNYRSHQLLVDFVATIFQKTSFLFFNQTISKSSVLNQENIQVEIGMVVSQITEKEKIEGIFSQEALGIALFLKELLEKKEEGKKEKIGILFKSLRHSSYLLRFLEKLKISYVVQEIKKWHEFPLFWILKVLCFLGNHYKEKGEISWPSFKKLLFFLSFFSKEKIEETNIFQKISSLFPQIGLFEDVVILKNILFNLGIDLSGDTWWNQEGYKILEQDGFSQGLIFLKDNENEDLKTERNFGNAPNVFIMTIHSSKGLEFETVFLAGIYQEKKGDGRHKKRVKASPMAYLYPNPKKVGKEFLETPWYIKKKYEEKLKQEEENLRLLYVALTRAKNQIYWTQLFCNEKEYFKEGTFSYYLIGSEVSDKAKKYFLKDLKYSFIKNELENNLLKINSLQGKYAFATPRKGSPLVGVIPSISVTQILTLLDCPKKFYFQSVLKEKENEEETFFSSEKKVSSKERGIKIHKIIEINLKNKNKEHKVLKAIGFDEENFLYFSERKIKIPFGNFFISGTIDLVVVNKKSQKIDSIWDFKTGSRDFVTEGRYWFQLYFYTLPLIKEKDQEFFLKLFYIDLEEIVEQRISVRDIEKKLQIFKTGLLNLSYMNKNHCKICEFYKKCHK